jgi:signal transduction histidine kinase
MNMKEKMRKNEKKIDLEQRYDLLHAHPGILQVELGLDKFPKKLPKKLTLAAIRRIVKTITVVDANSATLRAFATFSIMELEKNFYRLFSPSKKTEGFLRAIVHHSRLFRLEIALQSLRGPIVHVLVCGYRTENKLLLIMVDITAQKREEELDAFDRRQRLVLESLEEKEAVARQLLRIMSHELKTPLTPIQVRLQMLRDGNLGSLNKKQQISVLSVIKNFDRFATLITNIVDASKLSRGALQLALEYEHLEVTIQQVITFVGPTLRKNRIKLILRLAKLPLLQFDADRLQQVFFNLLDNALSFTPKGGTITVTAKKMKNNILVCVQNTGESLHVDELERIFRPFYQVVATDTRKKGGTGLGLAICRGIVMQHGGKIWAEGLQRGGVKILFTLPCNTKKLRIGRREKK